MVRPSSTRPATQPQPPWGGAFAGVTGGAGAAGGVGGTGASGCAGSGRTSIAAPRSSGPWRAGGTLGGDLPRKAAALPVDGVGGAATASEGAPVRLPRGFLPPRQHPPARQRQGGPGAAVPVRSARCPGAGALRGGGGRPHRLPHEAAHAGWHHAPALHRDGAAPPPDPFGAPAQDELDALPWRLRTRRETQAISAPCSGEAEPGGGTCGSGGRGGQVQQASARTEAGLGGTAAPRFQGGRLLLRQVRG
jgi:hypothetical protein